MIDEARLSTLFEHTCITWLERYGPHGDARLYAVTELYPGGKLKAHQSGPPNAWWATGHPRDVLRTYVEACERTGKLGLTLSEWRQTVGLMFLSAAWVVTGEQEGHDIEAMKRTWQRIAAAGLANHPNRRQAVLICFIDRADQATTSASFDVMDDALSVGPSDITGAIPELLDRLIRVGYRLAARHQN